MLCSTPGDPWGVNPAKETLGIDDGSGRYDCDGAGVWRGGGRGVCVYGVSSPAEIYMVKWQLQSKEGQPA